MATAAVLMFTSCAAQPDQSGGEESGNAETPVTLRAVTAWDSSNAGHYEPFLAFVAAMEEETDSGITIEIVGGPETMPPTELAENLANGTIDLAYNTASYYSNSLPESLVVSLTNLSPKEWRDKGLYDVVNEWHTDVLNQRLLGRFGWGQQYAIYTKNPVTSLDDFVNMRVRGVAVYYGILKQLGAEMVDMPASDIYNALERGTVEGTAWPSPGVTDLSLQEVIGAVILPTFYNNGMGLYINESTWNKLSDTQRAAVERAVIKAEEFGPKFAEELRDRENAVLEAAGVEIIELKGADAKGYLEAARLGAVDVLVNMGIDQARAQALVDQFNS